MTIDTRIADDLKCDVFVLFVNSDVSVRLDTDSFVNVNQNRQIGIRMVASQFLDSF
jgi:hypothetical protein